MKILYIFSFLMISGFVKSQNLNCSDFRIGKFKIETTNYKLPATNVIRTEKIQKESSQGFNDLEGTIEWKSECEYELIYIDPSPEINGKKVNVKILEIDGKKAICSSTFEGMPGFVLNFEMEKLD